jgi:transcriptional regulator with PAS, ATPase and Fis domain
MRLEFVRIAEANDLINQLIEHHPQAIFLADHNFKIKFYNKSFQNLAEAEKSDILEHEFCDILGCNRRNKFDTEEFIHNHKCQIRELLSGTGISELTLIRDFIIRNRVVTKHLHFDTHRVIMNGVKYRLVVIDDRTQKH